MKKVLMLGILCCLVFAPFVNADYTTLNKDYLTLEVNDSPSGGGKALKTVFNDFFGLVDGDGEYATTGTELYRKRVLTDNSGNRGDVTWIGSSSSTFYASFVSAGNSNALSITETSSKNNLLDADGQAYFTKTFTSGENQTLRSDTTKINVPTGVAFAWKLAGLSSISALNNDLIHMIALDVSDLMWAKIEGLVMEAETAEAATAIWAQYGITNPEEDEKNFNAYMMAWEDMSNGDFDYNDLVAVVSFIKPKTVGGSDVETTPEPATLLVLGLGLAGLPVVRGFRKKS